MYDTLVNRILELGDTQPDKLAAAFKTDRVTYGQLAEKVRLIGSKLIAMGIKKGDRVLFTAVSKPVMVAVYLGIQYAGAVAVFEDKNGTVANAALIYEDAGAVLFLTDKPMKEYADGMNLLSLKKIYLMTVQQLEEEQIPLAEYVMPTEEAFADILFTTGTTGKPKGVVLSYKAVCRILHSTIEGIGMRQDDRVLLPLPLNHSFALRVLRATLYLGATLVLQNGFAFAKEVEDNQRQFQCTALAAVPASMEILRGQMQDQFIPVLDRFRYIEIGAGSLTIEQRKRLTKSLPNTVIYNTWGSSETGGALFVNVTNVAEDEKKVSAVGKPLPHIQVATLDENGKPFDSSPETPGRMALKGDMVMSCYWNRPELTEQTLKDGWLVTSDMVYVEDGYVYMLGRADDIINVGGEKVSPIEVENIAGQYEEISECACIGVSDPNGILGQIPVLFVVAKGSAYTEAKLQIYLSQHMERYKLPQSFVLLQELPRNRMQKIDRKALHAIWENRDNRVDLMNPVIQAIMSRRSIRKFTSQEIPQEMVEMIVEAGLRAPTGHNLQTWHFTVLKNVDTIQRLKTIVQKVCADQKKVCYGFENPRVLIVVSNDMRNPCSCQDASCASENMLLAAHSYGLGAVWLNPMLTICDEPEIRELLTELSVPGTHRVWSMIALGYPVADGVKLMPRKKDVVSYLE